MELEVYSRHLRPLMIIYSKDTPKIMGVLAQAIRTQHLVYSDGAIWFILLVGIELTSLTLDIEGVGIHLHQRWTLPYRAAQTHFIISSKLNSMYASSEMR